MAMDLSLNEIIHAICMRNNNYFVDCKALENGEFELSGGEIRLSLKLRVGAWVLLSPGVGCFRVLGMEVVDGGFVYRLENSEGIDYSWTGIVYEMRLPLNFIKTAERVLEWANSEEAKPSSLAGETVAGVYTWRRTSNSSGLPIGWQELFAKELNIYRRHVTGVRV